MELLERVVELSLEGYCCSQVMALLLLELLGEEDDGFVRAMGGLINGGGYSGGDCGCMSGGACLISYITGKGGENESELRGHVSALCHFTHWFAEEMKERIRQARTAGKYSAADPTPQDGALPGDNGAVL